MVPLGPGASAGPPTAEEDEPPEEEMASPMEVDRPSNDLGFQTCVLRKDDRSAREVW